MLFFIWNWLIDKLLKRNYLPVLFSAPIGVLAVGRSKPVYIKNGSYYLKLNDEFHVKVKLDTNRMSWIGAGSAKRLNSNERVRVVQTSNGF